MYLYQPCLLTMVLYQWAFDQSGTKTRWLRIAFLLAILAASEWELACTQVWFYPAALLLPLLSLLGRSCPVAWAEVSTAALFGGLLSWKAADLWPLLPGLKMLCAALLLVPVVLLCRDREDRFLACALGSLLFESFFCLREYMLFSFCVIRLGSRDGLSLGTAAVCLYSGLEQVGLAVHSKKKHTLSVGI